MKVDPQEEIAYWRGLFYEERRRAENLRYWLAILAVALAVYMIVNTPRTFVVLLLCAGLLYAMLLAWYRWHKARMARAMHRRQT